VRQSWFSGIDAQRVNFIDDGLETQVLYTRLMELESRTLVCGAHDGDGARIAATRSFAPDPHCEIERTA